MLDATVRLGRVEVTPIMESELWLSLPQLIPDAEDAHALLEQHRSWTQPSFNERRHVRLPVWCYLVRTPEALILVDAGNGNDKPRGDLVGGQTDRLQGPFLDDLQVAGVAPGDVDFVVSTHMHFDHVGWYTRLDGDAWTPTFPNARYLFVEAEWQYWKDEDPVRRPAVADSLRPVIEAGLVDMVRPEYEVASEVRLASTPGHTPGHVCVRIDSEGASGVITGDLFHHKLLLAEPDQRDSSDMDAARGIAQRRGFLDRYGDSDTVVFGTHFEPPAVGRVVTEDAGHRWRPLDAR